MQLSNAVLCLSCYSTGSITSQLFSIPFQMYVNPQSTLFEDCINLRHLHVKGPDGSQAIKIK